MTGSKSSRSRKPRAAPIDLAVMAIDYRAGVLSDREIGAKHGCSHAAVQKRARQLGWERDLRARINARADKLVARAAVATQVAGSVAADSTLNELATVLANGAAVAAIRLEHRSMIARVRRLVLSLIAELEAIDGHPEIVAMVWDALSLADERGAAETIGLLADAVRVVSSVPSRTNTMKTLLEAMRNLLGMEREAFGLDTSSGSDGRPMVIIRDFTGRGSPEAPPRPLARAERAD